MSEQIEYFRNVNVTWDKITNFLSIDDERNLQLAALFVQEKGKEVKND